MDCYIVDETVLSIVQVVQRMSGRIFGVKYKLFGVEGRAVTLTSYGQWTPFCLQYSSGGKSKVSGKTYMSRELQSVGTC